MTASPLVVAHRGYSARHPENTVAACRAAILAGADLVEADVRFSAEGTLFCFHDPDLQRLTGRAVEVKNCTDADLRALRYDGAAPAALADIVAEVRGRCGLLIDVKLEGQDVLEAMYRDLECNGWPDNLWLGLRNLGQVEQACALFATRARVVALMPSIDLARDFIAAGASALRIWEAQVPLPEATALKDLCPVWITAGHFGPYPAGDTDAAGLRAMRNFGAAAILLNDPTVLALEAG